MRLLSLQEIMNDMAQHPETIAFQAEPDDHHMPSEEDLYRGIDPLLSDLHKQQEDAGAYLEKLIRENGKDDAMALVAADMFDSTQSAFATRLMELRDRKALRDKVRHMKQEQRTAIEEQRKKSIWQRTQFFMLSQKQQAELALKTQKERTVFLLMFLFWMLHQSIVKTNEIAFSLAHDFSAASQENDRRRIASE